MRIGLLHPGAMGASVAATLTASGHNVLWCEGGRSAATRERATAAGATATASLERLAEDAEIILSVCPPDAAGELADEVLRTGFAGVFVDANAIAPATARQIAARFGDRYVDGGIIGPPAREPGTTRLYLSGVAAVRVAELFTAGPLEAIALRDGDATGASALKMAYAAYTKGHAALLLAARALADANGVGSSLDAEWDLSQPGLRQRLAGSAQGVAPKSWRFAGEMLEIAATFAAADLPNGFHLGAAEVYERLASFKDTDDVDVDAVLARLIDKPASRPD